MKEQLLIIRDTLNAEIISCNKYLTDRNDFGKTQRRDDPFEFISFTRGKIIGLVIAREQIDLLLKQSG